MEEARVSFVFVDTHYSKDMQLDMWDEIVSMRSIISLANTFAQDPRVITMEQLMVHGKKISQHRLAKRLGMHAPNRCCAIFYRSNETLNQPSTPGVMMSHDNLTFMASLIGKKILKGELGNFPDIHTKALKMMSSLPISKPTAFVMEVLLPIALGACVYTSSIKLSVSGLWHLVMFVEPNIICVTTRSWIHLRNKITEKTHGFLSLRNWLSKYAKRTMLDSHLKERKVPKLARAVIKGIGEQLGLGHAGLFLSFGSALPQSYFEYFLSLNIQVCALREVRFLSGPHCICLNENEKLSAETMGTIFPEFQTQMVRLGKTGAHRMLVKGRHVCMGILNDSITDHIDSSGYLDTEALTLTIQDELYFVGSTGDEVVLTTGAVLSSICVETSFKRLVPIVASCMLVGENMKTAALLITLKTIINPETLQATDVLTQEVQVWCEQKLQTQYLSADHLAHSKKLHVVINGALILINRLIKRCGGWIEAYKILPRNFSMVDMEIDPITHELNRNLILQRYRDDLLTLYPKY
ncbi:long-chain-fatty-acid--CoA ligase ACSBG2 [Elysia marginata]|uniref:Long-chain-fatty-acid--CoA ligase ACSBG2 n=1 Tax=Elysia marginata TaxID=1093978 RepID=A0AAV4FNM6_9GAST|nr:long-chain-fatty-acid--CoA ligase ACSBG2 [Elysia marginata]